MTLKDLIVQELEQISEASLVEVLEYVRRLKLEQTPDPQDQVWQAYLDSEQEREEVYRRLADS